MTVIRKLQGAELIELAWMVIEELQYMAGGVVAFLEAEPREKLLSFLSDQSFSTV